MTMDKSYGCVTGKSERSRGDTERQRETERDSEREGSFVFVGGFFLDLTYF